MAIPNVTFSGMLGNFHCFHFIVYWIDQLFDTKEYAQKGCSVVWLKNYGYS